MIKIREIILKNPDYLQSGLSLVDHQLDTGDHDIIDFLGVDNTGRLVIVNIDIEENVGMMVSALSQIQWLKKNEGLLKRLYFNEKADFKRSPQVLLIGPGFSEKLKEAAKQLLYLDMKFIEFKYLIAVDMDAIIFEEVFNNKQSKEKDPKNKNNLPSGYLSGSKIQPGKIPQSVKVSLTQEEIEEFIDSDKDFKRDKITE